jgi:hypothetical protein
MCRNVPILQRGKLRAGSGVPLGSEPTSPEPVLTYQKKKKTVRESSIYDSITHTPSRVTTVFQP